MERKTNPGFFTREIVVHVIENVQSEVGTSRPPRRRSHRPGTAKGFGPFEKCASMSTVGLHKFCVGLFEDREPAQAHRACAETTTDEEENRPSDVQCPIRPLREQHLRHVKSKPLRWQSTKRRSVVDIRGESLRRLSHSRSGGHETVPQHEPRLNQARGRRTERNAHQTTTSNKRTTRQELEQRTAPDTLLHGLRQQMGRTIAKRGWTSPTETFFVLEFWIAVAERTVFPVRPDCLCARGHSRKI